MPAGYGDPQDRCGEACDAPEDQSRRRLARGGMDGPAGGCDRAANTRRRMARPGERMRRSPEIALDQSRVAAEIRRRSAERNAPALQDIGVIGGIKGKQRKLLDEQYGQTVFGETA